MADKLPHPVSRSRDATTAGSIDCRALADAIAEILCIFNGAGGLEYVNRAWFAFTGASEDIVGDAWTTAVHPDDFDRFERLFAAHAVQREPFTIELRLRRSDGTYRPMRARAAPIGGGGVTSGFWAATFVAIEDERRGRSESARRVNDGGLRRLFEANVVGIVFSNNAGAILDANDAFLEMIGYSRSDLNDGRIDWRALTPHEWLPRDERAIEEIAACGVMSQYEKEYIRKDGTRVPVSLGGARIAGTDDEQICYIVDLSDIRRAEAALRRSESRFRQINDANVIGIIQTRVTDDVITEANAEFLRILGYSRADFERSAIRLTDVTPPEWRAAAERAIRDLRTLGRFGPVEEEYYKKDGSRVPVLVGGALLGDSNDETVCYVLDLSVQKEATRRYRVLAEALPGIIMLADAERRPVYVNRHYEEYTGISSADVALRWREAIHPDDIAAIDRARAAGLPYEVEYRLRRASDGTFRWHFARCMEIPSASPRERWLAVATDIDDRKRAEDALRFMEKAGARLAQSLDLQTTFETLLDLVVPEFGDWSAITLRDEAGEITTVVARHKDPSKAHLAREICGVNYFEGSQIWGTGAVYRTGAPQLLSQVTYDDLKSAVKPQYLSVLEQMGFGSLIALPILSGGEVIGSFGIVSAGDQRQYSAADLPALEELARRAGFAIANAREYEREHRVANLLQEAALPRKLPTVAGLTFDAYYQAGRAEALIGGDWFDALIVGDGRVVLSVGDVAGSGLGAAVLMSNVRQVIRGAAHVYANPMMILEVADRALRSEHENAIVTAFVGVVDPLRRTILYASAGHLPALLRTADGEVTELRAPGLPLGLRDLAASESRTDILPSGSCLLLYTDGLVEWSRDTDEGEALLRRRFAEAGASWGAQPAKALVESVLPATGPRDDVAVLTVSIDS